MRNITKEMLTHRIGERIPSYNKIGLSYSTNRDVTIPLIVNYDARHMVEFKVCSSIVAPENEVNFAVSHIARQLNDYFYGDIIEEVNRLEYAMRSEFYLSEDSETFKQLSKLKEMLKVLND